MSKAGKLLKEIQEQQKISFSYDKKYYSDETVSTEDRFKDWVEEMFMIATPVLATKAMEWAKGQMYKHYGKPSKELQKLIDKEVKSALLF